MTFKELGLIPELLSSIEAQGYEEPTPIQEKSIPVILEKRDVLGSAQTGTGKTAAFTLPVLQLLHESTRNGRHPRVLVLTPTRELAAQVEDSVKTYGSDLKTRSVAVFGGVGINPQINRLRQGVDILVATPGRLLDHVGQKTVDLSKIEILILDEADRMLDMGFIHDIRKVLELLPEKRQNLLFSATFPKAVKKLSHQILHEPVTIEADRKNSTAEKVKQVVHIIEKGQKRHLLSHLIREEKWTRALVFTRTKWGADKLAKQLSRDGISASAIHGGKTQSARTRVLADFKAGQITAMIATDIAARGIDIAELPHVVNYELPNVPEDYVHRIGRTGRAGSDGLAISLVSGDEKPLLDGIEKFLKWNIKRRNVKSFVKVANSGSQNRRGGGNNRPRRPSSNKKTGSQSQRPQRRFNRSKSSS
ncbi:MAG: DEAD/DEAH box helicase [Lentisphaerae bacterium]|nr:DEAD/DEAH box helicase [Lentisphaerota bacterium]MCP4099896.1 DEAD/DEAH box helicase [Lentisphaerota bacterium]